MSVPLKKVVRGLFSLRGFARWLKVLATLGAGKSSDWLDDARLFREELTAWVDLLHMSQFSEARTDHIMAGLMRRHQHFNFDKLESPDALLLSKLGPLIYFIQDQQRHFEKGTVGHNCAVMLQLALFRGIRPGATIEQVAQAVRVEFDAQLSDACETALAVDGAAGSVLPDDFA